MNEHESRQEESTLIQEYWDNQSPLLDRLHQGVQEYVNHIEGLNRVFQGTHRDIVCIDERVGDGVHVPGSGILLGKQKAKEVIRKVCPTGLWSHPQCGAGQKAYESLPQDEKQKYANADTYARAWVQELAREEGLEYKGERSVYVKDLHPARVVYYDGTGKLELSGVEELPKGFIISRKYVEKEDAQDDLDLAISIALSKHGFGERFKERQELLIIPIGDPTDSSVSLEKLKEEVEEIVSRYPGRVKIDGFNAPR